MSFIRKRSVLLALLAVLAAAVAAPYLIPENPDAAVFRSGVLGALLLAACFVPVQEALLRCTRRELACGLCWGFLFAAALSAGSELFVYNGLLPGFGSAVRRAAVPVLAAPLLGALAARVMCTQPRAKEQRRIPVAAFAAALLVCWLPLLLAYFPGMINYDFPGQYGQHLSGEYSRIHPLMHSLLTNSVITLGEVFASRTFGLLLLTVVQMALFALALGDACAFALRRNVPLFAVLLMAALFALHPIFSVMALSMTKDTLFAAAVLALSLKTWELLEAPDAFLKNRSRCALYVFLAVCTALLRNNGVFALILLLPGIVIAARGVRRRVCALAALCAGASALAFIALNLALQPAPMYSFQLYSLPAQQLVRAYNYGDMSEADRQELEGWYTSEFGLAVHEHLGDGAKGYLDEAHLSEAGSDFLGLWARNAPKNIRVYAEAFLMLNVGSWYPDDLSHASIYRDVSYNDKGYLQTQEYDMSEYGIQTTCFLPAVRNLYERICRRNVYQKYPVISILFCTATPLWVMALAMALLIARGQSRLLPATLAPLGIWLSYLFGPCTLPRYALPLFCAAPVLLAAALCAVRKGEAHA